MTRDLEEDILIPFCIAQLAAFNPDKWRALPASPEEHRIWS
jgi:hypothetical protein